jgi:hypothetical protein
MLAKQAFMRWNVDLTPVASVHIDPLCGYKVHIPQEFNGLFIVFFNDGFRWTGGAKCV